MLERRYRHFYHQSLWRKILNSQLILNCNSQKVVYLLKCRICGEAPYVGKEKRNLEQDLIIIKVHAGPIEKNVKYHSSVLMNIMGNTVIMELMIGSSH